MKEEKHSYIKGLLHGIGTLLTGMKVTGREFFTPKVTEQYPENRATLKISPRIPPAASEQTGPFPSHPPP